MQRAVLYRRIGDLERQLEYDQAIRHGLRRELVETRYRLRLARAGLLIALPCVLHPAARALVAYALEDSETHRPAPLPFAS